MKRPLVYYGNPTLRRKSDPVKEITPEIHQVVQDLIETTKEHDGAGMAAVQIGVLHRVFILCRYIHHDDGRWTMTSPYVYINPRIVEYSEETLIDTEGCLSLPGMRAKVERPEKIRVIWTDLEGKEQEEAFEGYNARSILHENDHLNGVLYIDRVDDKTRRILEPDLRAMKKKYNP